MFNTLKPHACTLVLQRTGDIPIYLADTSVFSPTSTLQASNVVPSLNHKPSVLLICKLLRAESIHVLIIIQLHLYLLDLVTNRKIEWSPYRQPLDIYLRVNVITLKFTKIFKLFNYWEFGSSWHAIPSVFNNEVTWHRPRK
jgi:hypothetical protein